MLWENDRICYIDHYFILGSFRGGVGGKVYQNSSFFSLPYSIELTLIDLFDYLNASSVDVVLLNSLLFPITLLSVN